MNFASKVLPVLEVAKRTDNDLISLYKKVWGINYKGLFKEVVDHYFNVLVLDNVTLNEIVDLTIECLCSYNENKHIDSRLKITNKYSVFIENEFSVEQFIEDQYSKNKEMECENV